MQDFLAYKMTILSQFWEICPHKMYVHSIRGQTSPKLNFLCGQRENPGKYIVGGADDEH